MSPSPPIQPGLCEQRIVTGLRALGVIPGMKLMVHSSLSRFGHVIGGARTVISSLQTAVGPGGTLLMPSFNHATIFDSEGRGEFDPLRTHTTNGAIPDTFWRLPGVRRSLDPTHAFACWGADAERYIGQHHRTLTLGGDSPLGMLAREGGFGLLLGVDYRSNTLHHVAEFLERSPCLGWRMRSLPVRLPDGRLVQGRTWSFRNGTCPFNDAPMDREDCYGVQMTRLGLERTGRIGAALARLFRLADCLELVRAILRRGGAGYPPCRGCTVRPKYEPVAVESDWDVLSDRLLPDSPAWEY